MYIKKWLLIILSLICVLTAGCNGTEQGSDEAVATATLEITSQTSAPGGLPTPFNPQTMGDAYESSYGREKETVDYVAISGEEYCIRSIIETKGVKYAKDSPDENNSLNGVEMYGVEKYYSIDDMVVFADVGDMEAILKNPSFLSDFQANTGVAFKTTSYYLPENIAVEHFVGALTALDSKPYFELFGRRYTEDQNYYSILWSVYAVQDSPSAEEIARFYSDLDDLQLKNDNGPTGTVYHFTSKNGCAFFEKFSIETNNPATAYIWEQDDVIGVIILPGEYKTESLDLCVLEKHEL